MLTPQPPASTPEFNLGNAQRLPMPGPLSFGPLVIPQSPGPLTNMLPLPMPEPLALFADPVPAPKIPPQMAKPIPRPLDPSPTAASQTAQAPKALSPPPPSSVPEAGAGEETGLGNGFRLLFMPESTELPAAAALVVRELADSMSREPTLRLKLAAYASGEAENPVPARRLSLLRALKLREALVAEGIDILRIDIMALGITATAPPRDRVDLLPMRR